MIGVTNTYIDETLQEIGSKSFIGTYSSDTVPYLKDHKYCYDCKSIKRK